MVAALHRAVEQMEHAGHLHIQCPTGQGKRTGSMTAFFFYVFSIIAVMSAVMVVIARNPVHAVLFLILAFFNAAGLFVLLGAEFLAMLLVIVYVGAVAVLFLFVVMMLDVDFAELRAEMAKYVPVALLIGVILLMQFGLVLGAWVTADGVAMLEA